VRYEDRRGRGGRSMDTERWPPYCVNGQNRNSVLPV
jgi:hypothetical protein